MRHLLVATLKEGRARTEVPAAWLSPNHLPYVRGKSRCSPPQEKLHVRIPLYVILKAQKHLSPREALLRRAARKPQGRELGLPLDYPQLEYEAPGDGQGSRV